MNVCSDAEHADGNYDVDNGEDDHDNKSFCLSACAPNPKPPSRITEPAQILKAKLPFSDMADGGVRLL